MFSQASYVSYPPEVAILGNPNRASSTCNFTSVDFVNVVDSGRASTFLINATDRRQLIPTTACLSLTGSSDFCSFKQAAGQHGTRDHQPTPRLRQKQAISPSSSHRSPRPRRVDSATSALLSLCVWTSNLRGKIAVVNGSISRPFGQPASITLGTS